MEWVAWIEKKHNSKKRFTVKKRTEGKPMKIIKVLVDKLPKDCIECPISRSYTRECGEIYTKKGNGSATHGKKVDDRCMLREGVGE